MSPVLYLSHSFFLSPSLLLSFLRFCPPSIFLQPSLSLSLLLPSLSPFSSLLRSLIPSPSLPFLRPEEPNPNPPNAFDQKAPTAKCSKPPGLTAARPKPAREPTTSLPSRLPARPPARSARSQGRARLKDASISPPGRRQAARKRHSGPRIPRRESEGLRQQRNRPAAHLAVVEAGRGRDTAVYTTSFPVYIIRVRSLYTCRPTLWRPSSLARQGASHVGSLARPRDAHTSISGRSMHRHMHIFTNMGVHT